MIEYKIKTRKVRCPKCGHIAGARKLPYKAIKVYSFRCGKCGQLYGFTESYLRKIRVYD